MPDLRAFWLPNEAAPAVIQLGPAESHHLVAVNRCGRGDPVVVFDGGGREWRCECTDPSKVAAQLRVKEALPPAARPNAITLAQAMPKGAAMDEIVRQATELGVARIVPLNTERVQVHLDADRANRKIEKWQTVSIEAAKQCGNPWLPEISPIQDFAAFLASPLAADLKLVASLQATAGSLRKVMGHYREKHGHGPRSVAWLVGPEGDFSVAEMTAAVMAGFAPVSLGPLVLRCDTAAVYAVSVISHELLD